MITGCLSTQLLRRTRTVVMTGTGVDLCSVQARAFNRIVSSKTHTSWAIQFTPFYGSITNSMASGSYKMTFYSSIQLPAHLVSSSPDKTKGNPRKLKYQGVIIIIMMMMSRKVGTGSSFPTYAKRNYSFCPENLDSCRSKK